MVHTDFALRRPVTTLMAFAAVAVIGLMSLRLLPLEQYPDVSFPFMGVGVPYPGSTPEETEELITRPIEEALATLPGIEEIRSTSSDQDSRFEIRFAWGTDINTAAFEVRNKMDTVRATLPKTADRMWMWMASTADAQMLTVRFSADQDLSSQYDLLDRYFKKPIERLDGVARVELAGVEAREVRILVDPGRLAAHAVDIRQLVQLLEKSNFSVGAGQITGFGERLLVRPLGEFRSLDEIRNLTIKGNVHVADVASVELVSPEILRRRHLDGRPAVGLDVFKSSGANVVDVVDRVMKVIERNKALPQMQGIRVFVIDNQAEAIRTSLSDLTEAGLVGAALAFIVLFMFLRHWPTTLIVAAAVPLSLLVTLAVMYFAGLTINVMSMMGMMLAVGMLVDNAVVVTESVFRHRQLDPGNPQAATLAGVKEVGVATLAGTATCVVVFLPILFGSNNQISIWLTHAAIPICVAMVASLIIAQTLIPMATSRFPAPPPIDRKSWIARLQDRYTRWLDWSIHHRGWTLLGLVAVLALTVGLITVSSMFPGKFLKFDPGAQDGGNQVFLNYNLKGSHPIERVEAAVQTIEKHFEGKRDALGIKSLYSVYDQTSGFSIIVLKPRNEGGLKVQEFIAENQDSLPEIIIGKPSFKWDDENSMGGQRFSVQLTGESTEKLALLADDVARVMASAKGLEAVRSEAREGDEEVQIVVNRQRAAALGLTSGDVAQAVAAGMRGDRLREFRGTERELTLRLAFRESDRQTVDNLAEFPIYLPGGARVPLSAIADFRIAKGPRSIERMDRLTSVAITGNVKPDATLDGVGKEVEALLKNYQMPPGYSWKLGKGFDRQDEDTQTMVFNLLLAIAMIYLVMAAVFESTVYPLSIITSIFMAIVGVIWFMFVTRTTVTLMAFIGVQILIGVVVNIGIVLVAHINDLRAAGMERMAAIVQAGRDRLRPILMTTLTASLGLLPLAAGEASLAVGGGGPSYAPMARAIMGGLLAGAVMSLFVVPAFYVWIDNGAARVKRFLLHTRVPDGRPAPAQTTAAAP
ncbi:MAG TPA: efflux RND transporter permease subunit [Steroidobacteraceae bacterium]|nr:efflux RND transporter permease subunit [Steroidobacteraceae bacterium]